MSKNQKRLNKVLAGSGNVGFADVLKLAEAFGFSLVRTSGSLHILAHPRLPELLNLQKRGSQAKPYQIRQLLALVEEHNLRLGEE
jgi:hypothetical protein